jgi:hypothetical protein
MQQQRVNTPVLFDGAVSLKIFVTTGTSWVGWRMRSTACFSQFAAGVCCNDPAFNISWPGVPAAYPDFVS